MMMLPSRCKSNPQFSWKKKTTRSHEPIMTMLLQVVILSPRRGMRSKKHGRDIDVKGHVCCRHSKKMDNVSTASDAMAFVICCVVPTYRQMEYIIGDKRKRRRRKRQRSGPANSILPKNKRGIVMRICFARFRGLTSFGCQRTKEQAGR